MKHITLDFLIICAAFLLVGYSAKADVTLPRLVSDGMVLQRDAKTNVWGWADAGEKVVLKINGKTFRTVTGNDRRWAVVLSPMKAGGPFTLQISGNNTLTIKDVYFGDVWFCSGQSNMVLTMERVKEKYPDAIADADYPAIRNFFIPTASDVTGPQKDLPPGTWAPLNTQSVLKFGAVTYFFATQLYKKYHIPIGIVNSSVGGTPVEAWISEDGFKAFPRYEEMIRNFKDTVFMNRIRKQATANIPAPSSLLPDRGTSGPIPWYDPSFKPEGWHSFWLPGYWEDQGVKSLNGILWFRKEINVPASMTGKPAKLFMGRIIDADNTYINGVLVGGITYQYPPRRYEIAAGVLKPGKNVIVVKVTNTNGKGGFVFDKPYYLTAGDEKIDLRGDWQYEVGQVFPPKDQASGIPVTNFSAQNSPTGLYNTMVAPAVPYTVKGFLWYQGESNSGRPGEYEGLLKSLISDWRSKWGQGTLPFLYVQLPNFMEVQYSPSESQWAELREGQRHVLSVPNTAMITTIELGEWNDIHPLNKKSVGERLALAAINLAYQDKTVEYMGPLYSSAKIDGTKIILTFTHTGSGMIVHNSGELKQFAIAGPDKKFVWANARIEGDKVIVWSDAVASPAFVRYAWANNPEGCNLYNQEGLPASPFETGALR